MSGFTGLYFGDPAAPAAVQAQGLSAVQASTGEVLAATAGSAWANSLGPRLFDWGGRQFAPSGRTLDATEANASYSVPGLTFDRPVAEGVAQALRDGREAENRRQAIIARRSDSLATSAVGRGVVTFATAMLDPVNIGAALIPFVGEARMMQLLGTTSVAAVRAATGAANGALGMAVLEPLEWGLSRSEFNDRHMSETLAAIAFGGVLGAGLHVAGGAIGDMRRGGPPSWAPKPPKPTPVERAVAEAPPAARELMLRGAVAAVAEGRPVAVGAVMDLPTATTYRQVAGEAQAGAYATYTPGGLRIEARPEVVDLSTLLPSHMADGSVNPAYPHAEGLQPRDRSTAGSQDQINAIAANLQPERLAPSPEAGAGAPIVDARGVVESGNGRVAALERVYGTPELAHRAQAYRAFLESQGHDLSGIERPVLVGRRLSDLSPQEASAFARGANERPNLSMTAAEQARADADRAGRAIGELQPGQLTSGQNRDFTRAFLAMLPAEERGSLVLADGRLSSAGELRLRQAILAHSFGDSLGPLLEKLLNGEAENLKGIAGALADTAGPWGRMRAAAARGEIPPDLDITAGLGEAVQLVEKARRTGQPLAEVLAQTDAFTAPPGPATMALLRLMHRDEAMARALGREPLAELLTRYADEAMKVQPGRDLFGAEPAGPADLLRAAARHTDPAAATAQALDDLARAPRAAPEDVQASRAAAEAAQAADTLARLPAPAARAPTPLTEELGGKPPQEIVNPIDRSATPQEKLRQLEALTAENRPVVAEIMATIDRVLGTKSGDNAKLPENILSKASRPSILARKPWHDVEHIRDSYRFKTVVTSLEQVGQALEIVRGAGVGLVKVDTAKLFEPGEWGWRIVSFDLRMPNGQLVEWYLPIREMEAAKKEGGHHLFENWRNKTSAEMLEERSEYFADLMASRALYDQAFRQAVARMGYATEADAKAAFETSVERALETNTKLSETSWATGKSAGVTLSGDSQPLPGTSSQPAAGPEMIRTRPTSLSSSATGSDGSAMGASAPNIGAEPRGGNATVQSELRMLQQSGDDLVATLDALPLSPEERAQLNALRAFGDLAETEARATEAAALCMVGVR